MRKAKPAVGSVSSGRRLACGLLWRAPEVSESIDPIKGLRFAMFRHRLARRALSFVIAAAGAVLHWTIWPPSLSGFLRWKRSMTGLSSGARNYGHRPHMDRCAAPLPTSGPRKHRHSCLFPDHSMGLSNIPSVSLRLASCIWSAIATAFRRHSPIDR